jgi:FkbM family methyltransferase
MIKKFAIGSQQMILDTATSGEAAFWKFLAKQTWEPGTFKTFDRFIGKNSVCLDIGCWIGVTTIYIAKLADRVYGVEANPISYEMCRKNLLLNPEIKNCTVYNGAIYDKNGSITIYNDSDIETASGSSLISSNKNAKHCWTVPALTFSQYLQDNALSKVDFIKMDIEGAGAAVLSEMRGYIAEQHPVMHISLHPYNLPEKRKALENIVGILGSYKYHYDERGRQVALPQYIKKMTGFISAKIKNIGSFSVTVTNTQW